MSIHDSMKYTLDNFPKLVKWVEDLARQIKALHKENDTSRPRELEQRLDVLTNELKTLQKSGIDKSVVDDLEREVSSLKEKVDTMENDLKNVMKTLSHLENRSENGKSGSAKNRRKRT